MVPLVVALGGRATADVPKRVFPERSRGKSIAYFNDLLKRQDYREKLTLRKFHNDSFTKIFFKFDMDILK